MIEQQWLAADSTKIPENKFYEGLPVWSFTEDVTNQKVLLKPSLLEPRQAAQTVWAMRIWTTDERVVDLYEDQDVVTLCPFGFSYKRVPDLSYLDAIVCLVDGEHFHKGQNLFMNADVHTISRIESLGPRQPCPYAPVAKTFVAQGFLGRFR